MISQDNINLNNILIKEDINNYGIVYTPNNLVNKILDLIPINYYRDPSLRWLDIGAGSGAFSINLYNRLFNELSNNVLDPNERKEHIIKNMLFMCEIYEPHINTLKTLFTNEANIISEDFISLNKYNYEPFDFIIGNPPFNINGKLKTPTNNSLKKTDDGKQIYVEFVKKSLDLLYINGFLNIIIPSLWLKPDKAGLYNILTSNKIHKLVPLSTSQTQKEFNYKAQTPTTYFLIEKSGQVPPSPQSKIPIYDKITNSYIEYDLSNNFPIPTHGINIINKLLFFLNKYGSLKVYKTNTCPKNTLIQETYNHDFSYVNIKTCLLENNVEPKLTINYSNISQQFYKEPKLIMAHKMYGFPFYDISGIYGICARDNYIILEKHYNNEKLKLIQAFLSTKTALFLFSTTNYRMRYLERYAFEFIPNITNIPNFPNLINISREKKDKLLFSFFNFSQKEQESIENYSKNYNFFI